MARWIWILLLVAACKPKPEADDDSAGDDDSAEAATPEERATLVRVEPLQRGPIAELIASSATVDTERRADVVLEAPGTVEVIHVEEGDAVAAGAVLAELRNPQLKAELERAQASFDRAREQVASLRGLLDQGFLARNDFDEADLALRNATTTLEAAQAANRARLILSPIAGTVSRRDLRFGEAVSPGRLAFQVVDLGALRVDVQLPEADIARLRPGLSATVRSELLGGVEVRGSLLRIAPVVDAASGTVKVTVALDPAQRQLRPGMFVQVALEVARHEDAILVPKRALVFDEGEPYVFVVVDGKVSRRKLGVGFQERDRVEALDGVVAGDAVVVVGQGLLRDGVAVRVEAEPTESPAAP